MGQREMIWEEPPAFDGNNKYEWFYSELCKNQNKWARYPKMLKSKSVGAYPKSHPGFEFKMRPADDGSGLYIMYVRYVGEG